MLIIILFLNESYIQQKNAQKFISNYPSKIRFSLSMKTANKGNNSRENFSMTLNPAYIFMQLPSQYNWIKEMNHITQMRKIKSEKEDSLIQQWIQKCQSSSNGKFFQPFQFSELTEIRNILKERITELQKKKQSQKIKDKQTFLLLEDGIQQIKNFLRKIQFLIHTTLTKKKEKIVNKARIPYSIHVVSQSETPKEEFNRRRYSKKQNQVNFKKGLTSFFKQFDFNLKDNFNTSSPSQTFFKPKFGKTASSSKEKEKKQQNLQKIPKETFYYFDSKKTQSFALQSHSKPFSKAEKKASSVLSLSKGKKQSSKIRLKKSYHFYPTQFPSVNENIQKKEKQIKKHVFLKRKKKEEFNFLKKRKNSRNDSRNKSLKKSKRKNHKSKSKLIKKKTICFQNLQEMTESNKEEQLKKTQQVEDQSLNRKSKQKSEDMSDNENTQNDENQKTILTKEQLKEVFDDLDIDDIPEADNYLQGIWNRKKKNKKNQRNSSFIGCRDGMGSFPMKSRRRGSSVLLVQDIIEKNSPAVQRFQTFNRVSTRKLSKNQQQKIYKNTGFKKKQNIIKRRSIEQNEYQKEKAERMQFYNFFDEKGYKEKLALKNNDQRLTPYVKIENYHEVNPFVLRKQIQEGLKFFKIENSSLFQFEDDSIYREQLSSLWDKSLKPAEKRIFSSLSWRQKVHKYGNFDEIQLLNLFRKTSNCLYQTDGCSNKMKINE